MCRDTQSSYWNVQVEEEMQNTQESSLSLQTEQSELDNRISRVNDEKNVLLGEQMQLLEKKTALELHVRDLGEEVKQQQSARVIYVFKTCCYSWNFPFFKYIKEC